MILPQLKEMDNKQLYNFTREQTQVFLTGLLGDGCISTTNSGSYIYTTNCKHLEYLEFKKKLLGKGNIRLRERNGYSQTPIYTMYGGAYPELFEFKEFTIQDVIENLDLLGLALWFYDDGSLHKRDLYYNLNTQKFPKYIQEGIFIPWFDSLGIKANLRHDTKRGKELYYLGINKYEGANIISEILSRYPLDCYSYKLWSSETILKWSKLQEQVKSIDENLTNRQLAYKWRFL